MPNNILGDGEAEAAKEAGKAVQETAKAASKTLDLIRDAGKIFGPAAEELAALLGDRLRYWRFLNLNNIHKKVEKMREEQNISPDLVKFLSFGDSFRVIDAASLEDDDTVQELWARLLVNSTKEDGEPTIKKVHIDLIKSFSSAEVLFLDLIWTCECNANFKSNIELKNFNETMNKRSEEFWRKLPQDTRNTSIQNLMRLRCITFRGKQIDGSHLFRPIQIDSTRHIINNIDPRVFINVLNSVLNMAQIASGVKEPAALGSIPLHSSFGQISNFEIDVPEMSFMLTALGRSVMKACSAPPMKDLAPASGLK